MSNNRTGHPSKTLSHNVRGYFMPRDAVFHRVCERDGWIEVRARNGTECEYQSNQGSTGGDCVSKQGDGDVPARQTFAHDARADDRCDEEKSPAELCCDTATESLHSAPMRSISFLMASESRLLKGKHTKRLIRRSSMMYASRKARASCSGDPTTAAGSGTPQCAVIGWPGQTGHTSFAALSQTVNTKSSSGAPGFANSSHALLRNPATGKR